MSYGSTWNSRVNRASKQQWIEGEQFENLIRYLEGINFNIQKVRDAAIDEMAKIPVRTKIADPKSRFPFNDAAGEWDIYYSMNFECIAPYLADLRIALNYKPPENAFAINNEMPKPTESGASNSSSETKDDKVNGRADVSKVKMIPEVEKRDKAKLLFENALKEIRKALGTNDCGFDRAAFEKFFGLKWNA